MKVSKQHKTIFSLFPVLLMLVLLFVAFVNPDEDDDLLLPRPLGDFQTTTIPIKRIGRLMIIEAEIDSVFGNFIFDTGAQNLVLNSTYFRDGKKVYGATSGGITGTAAAVYRKRIKHFQMGNVYYEKLDATLANLGHIENKRGVKILGLIGVNMIKGMEVHVNLKEGYLRFYRTDKDGSRLEDNGEEKQADVVGKLKVINNVFITQATIAGKKVSFSIDSGAESNIVSSVLSNKIINSIEINRRSVLRGVGGQAREVFSGVMTDFKLNGISIDSMQTLIVNMDAMSESYGYSIQGMLGYDFFNQGIISFNAKNKELGIQLYKEGDK